MPLLNLRNPLRAQQAQKKSSREAMTAPPWKESSLHQTGTDESLAESQKTTAMRRAAESHGTGSEAMNTTMLWNRNLTWEQREQGERLRRANGLLSWPSESTSDISLAERAVLRPAMEGIPFFATCMNPDCQTNWLKLWRRRRVPRMEGQWACSAECMHTFVESAVARELNGDMPWGPQPHRHRMPLGLILLKQGCITEEQLRTALEAQRTAGKGRIGAWLMRQCNLPEERVTRALAMQWGCPILPVTIHHPESVATLIPRLFLDSFGLLPIRVASGRLLYLGFEDRLDAAATLAISRMTGLRVESGVVPATQYLRAHERMMDAAYPKTLLMEATTALSAAEKLTEAIERVRPHEARLVRLHQYFWLRMWRTPVPSSARSVGSSAGLSIGGAAAPLPVPRIHQVEDVLCRYSAQQVDEGI